MSPTSKSAIIENIFRSRWDDDSKVLSKSIVTLSEVQEAIRIFNRENPSDKISSRNPANFFKDFIRNTKSANNNWPNYLLTKGYTARQVTGKSNCFEFVNIPPGQQEPFTTTIVITPDRDIEAHKIQSVSMSLASRKLGRNDESWFIQVLVKLHIIETHISIYSKLKILQIDILQTNIKLNKAEIDALYLGIAKTSSVENNSNEEVIITCEAKGKTDDILVDQILAQIKAVHTMRAITQKRIIPMAAKVIGNSRIYIVQFEAINSDDVEEITSLKKESEAIYQLVPDVPGI